MRADRRLTLPRLAAAMLAAGLAAWLAAWATPALAGLPEAIDRVRPSIVAVGTFQKTRSPSFAFRGTGFAVGDGTLIVTNAHVLPETLQDDNRETMVVLAPGAAGRESEVRAVRLVEIDKDHDLALLRLSEAPLPALAVGDSDSVREGRRLAFTGFPLGAALGFVPVTHRGIVSAVTPIVLPAATARFLDERAVRRTKTGTFVVFQLDATAYPGNSGSPLFDEETGEVVAIMNMVFVKGTRETALSQPSGISFAVPARYLRAMLGNVR
jgi:S1-C subfamily serine protease